VHTNHFIDAVHGGHDLGAFSMPDSYVRLGRITRLIENADEPLGDNELHAALADHAEWPNSICCHPDTTSGPGERWKTNASVVMHPAHRRIDLTCGPPCENPWQTIDYSDLLGGQEA